MKNAEKKGFIMATNTKFHGTDSVGLVSGHAYSIINVKEGIVKGESIRLLRIRNPWGFQEYNGRWSDNSKEWMHEAKQVFKKENKQDANDGCFWMEYKDYLEHFETVDFCYQQKTICSKICKPDNLQKHRPHVYNLRLDTKQFVYIQACKRSYRFKRAILDNSVLVTK